MTKMRITGDMRRRMIDSARSGTARWQDLTRKEKIKVKEYEEQRRKLEMSKRAEEEAKLSIEKEQRIPMAEALKKRIWRISVVVILLVGLCLYLRFYQNFDAIVWFRRVLGR